MPLFSVLGSDQTWRVLGAGDNFEEGNEVNTVSFNTLNDLRDMMFMVESFRHAFSETYKTGTSTIAMISLLSSNKLTRPAAEKYARDLIEEMGLFVSSELVSNFAIELLSYQSGDYKDIDIIQVIADSFLLAMVKGEVAYDSIKQLIKVGNYQALEALQGYYQINTENADYDTFLDKAYEMFKPLSNDDMSMKVEWLPELVKLKAQASNDEGIALRYALANLDVVVLTGADFSSYNTHGELDKFDPRNNPNGMTDKYIEKRAEMLNHLLNDGESGIYRPNYVDMEIGKTLNSTGTDSSYVIFGTDANDKDPIRTLASQEKDYIFAGDGDDEIFAGKGDDYIEGGTGFDTYHIKDTDTIIDSDMQGKLIFGNTDLSDIYFATDTGTDWYSVGANGQRDGRFYLQREGNNLKVTDLQNEDTTVAIISDFFTQATQSGDFYSGLNLNLSTVADTHTPNGKDLVTLAGLSEHHNKVWTPAAEVALLTGNRGDLVYGTMSQGMTAYLGAGSDRAIGGQMPDYIAGQKGTDVLYGSPIGYTNANDHDTLIGGENSDIIYGVGGNDVLFGSDAANFSNTASQNSKGDYILGGSGQDYIYGSNARDVLMGGEDIDVIHGGAGDDIIVGDGNMRFNVKNLTLTGSQSSPSTSIVPINFPYIVPTPNYTIPDMGNNPTASFSYDASSKSWQVTPDSNRYLVDFSTHAWSASTDSNTGDYTITAPSGWAQTQHRVPTGGNKDYLYGGLGNDLVIGQDGGDYLSGGDGDDILWGDDNRDSSISGNDTLLGGNGSDRLFGGLADDHLSGGSGLDILNGGDGFDTYYLSGDDEADIIEDSDKQGEVLVDGVSWSAKVWNPSQSEQNVWQNGNNKIQLDGTNLLILNEAGNTIGVIKDFSEDTLGIAFNEAPTANGSLTEQEATAEQAWTYTLPTNSFSDPDNDTLLYTVQMADGSPVPAWLHIDSQTGKLSGTPPESGTLSLNIIATDKGGLSAEQSLSITIKAANQAPIVSEAIADQTAMEQESFSVSLAEAFSDADGDTLTYTATQSDGTALPSWLSLDSSSGQLSGTAPEGSEDLSVKVTATDPGGLSVSDEFLIDVKAQPVTSHTPWYGGTINGGTGDDVLTGSWFSDTINGNDGDDVINSGLGADTLNGGSGNDMLDGGWGNNTLNGGTGNDTLKAGLGADTYLFAANDGQDTIIDEGGLFDKLVLTGLSLSDLLLDNSGDDWVISVKDSDDKITIKDGNNWAGGRIETIQVGDDSYSYSDFASAVSGNRSALLETDNQGVV